MSIELVMPFSHLILCHPLLLLPFWASGSFPMSQFFASGGQKLQQRTWGVTSNFHSTFAFPGSSSPLSSQEPWLTQWCRIRNWTHQSLLAVFPFHTQTPLEGVLPPKGLTWFLNTLPSSACSPVVPSFLNILSYKLHFKVSSLKGVCRGDSVVCLHTGSHLCYVWLADIYYTSCLPCTVLSFGDTVTSKTDMVPSSQSFWFTGEERQKASTPKPISKPVQ